MAQKIKKYTESELIEVFGLKRVVGNNKHPLMKEWTSVDISLNVGEQYMFNRAFDNLSERIGSWNEEMLKMNFISLILKLGNIEDTDLYRPYYEVTIEATVEGHFLKTKTDMMIATGVLSTPKIPYFHFQEYKKVKDPSGDPAPQLLEAFLIAQQKNPNNQVLYGCTVSGREWEFYLLKNKTYCISRPYLCTNESDLLQIIAILRKFKEILDTKLLN